MPDHTFITEGPDPDANPAAPHVQVSVLCGQERHHWWCPHLGQALCTAVVGNAARYHIELVPGYEKRTSQEARNEVTAIALAENADWLLLIDNDTKPMNVDGTILDPFTLIYAGETYNLDIVAAPVPVIQANRWMLNVYEKHPKPEPRGARYRAIPMEAIKAWDDLPPDTPYVQVDAAGTGMMAIRRKVLETISHHYLGGESQLHRDPNDTRKRASVWRRPRHFSGETVIGEDILFCEVARDLGFHVHVLPAMLMGHLHTIDFANVPQIVFAASDTPTPADYGLESFHGLVPDDFSITPWIAQRLREAVALAPRYSGTDQAPDNVLHAVEFGAGISTLVLLDAGTTLVTIEDDDTHSRLVADAFQNVTVAAYQIWSYDRVPLGSPYGFVFIDGPRMTSGSERNHTLPLLFPHLANGAIVVLDDWQRGPLQEAVRIWRSDLASSDHKLVLLHTYGPPERQLAVFRYVHHEGL